MPRILSVLAVAALAFIMPSSVSAYPSMATPSLRLIDELQNIRLQNLEQQLAELKANKAVDISGDQKPVGSSSKPCPLAALHSSTPSSSSTSEPTTIIDNTIFTSSSLGDDSGSAADKATAVWNLITADTTPGSYPSTLGVFKLLLEDMGVTEDTLSDVMPDGRSKLIHSVGGHALGQLTWTTKLPYTGLFQSGAHHMVIRLSSAKDPSNTAVTAGISLKVFRDNLPSANSFMLHSFSSNSWNFFDAILQNHVSSVFQSELDPAKILLKKFQTTSTYAFYTGLSDWARYDENGNQTPDADLKFPFQLIMVPNADLKKAGAAIQPDGKVFTNQFNHIAQGSNLYTVYIQDEPLSEPYAAGLLNLNNDATGVLTTSNYGDNTLFFKHQRFEDDLALRADWSTTCPKPESCEYMYAPTQ